SNALLLMVGAVSMLAIGAVAAFFLIGRQAPAPAAPAATIVVVNTPVVAPTSSASAAPTTLAAVSAEPTASATARPRTGAVSRPPPPVTATPQPNSKGRPEIRNPFD